MWIVSALTFVLPPGGGIGDSPKPIPGIDVAGRYEAYRQRILELQQQGASRAAIASTLAREFSIEPITNGVQLIDSTGSSDVQLDVPSFSYDRLLRHYVMSASFIWKMCRIGDVESAPCWLKNRHDGMGGADGFAIKLNQEIFRVRSGFSLADNCGRPAGGFDQPAFDSDYGIGFKEQDVMTREEVNCPGGPYVYNWHRGVISEIFDFRDNNCGGERLQIDTKFGHSWSTSSLTGIGISSNGIQLSWENGESHFDAIPSGPLLAYC
jgi:hypothetical protein